MKKYIALGLVAISGIFFQSCKKDNNNPGGGTTAMEVRMTDAPGNYAALNVQITKVEAYLQNQGWVTLNSQTQAVSVLDLTNGAETSIASKSNLNAGFYSKLRLTFGNANSLQLSGTGGGSNISLSFGTNTSQQVEVEINEQVNANQTTSILLDFSVAQSIYNMGNTYFIAPLIQEIEDDSTGVQGSVQGAVTAAVTLSNGSNTYTTYVNSEGKFMIRGVEDGTYQIQVNAIASSNMQAQNGSMSNVVVTQGQITQVGNITLAP